MRDEFDTTATPAPAEASGPVAASGGVAPESHAFTFTGSGAEYFRIWIVNLFLSVATLGIYSAWAKVRRLQYFDRNTQLAGAVFDFRGDPRAILRGRVVAVILLVAYQYAFGFSVAVAATVILTLLALLPLMMRGALRFRLHNTEYRGLRLGFTGSIGGAYRVYVPWMVTFLLPSALITGDDGDGFAATAALLFLGWPLTQGAIKRYQQRHLRFGGAASGYGVPARRFYRPYLFAIAVVLHVAFFYFCWMCVYARVALAAFPAWFNNSLLALLSLPFLVPVYLVLVPFIQVRVANLTWSNTTFPGVGISSTMSARAFAQLLVTNIVLTLLTLGLYRPFAVVSMYRYRLAHLALITSASFEHTVAAAARARGGATGDGAADLLGIDFSL
jgi:uncharacterized membrane protein YjgN (DUF898 family)